MNEEIEIGAAMKRLRSYTDMGGKHSEYILHVINEATRPTVHNQPDTDELGGEVGNDLLLVWRYLVTCQIACKQQ